MMVKFMKQAFIVLVSFSGSLAIKYISLNNEQFLSRLSFFN